MKKNLLSLWTLKRVTTCALAAVIVVTSTPVGTVLASEVNPDSENTQVISEEVESNHESESEADISLDKSTEIISVEETTQLNETITENEIELTEGFYSVNAGIYHATKDELSGVASMLKNTYLLVDENGQATVYLNLQIISKYNMWSKIVQYPVGDGFQDAEITETDSNGNVTQVKFVLPQNTTITAGKVGTGSQFLNAVRFIIDFDSLVSQGVADKSTLQTTLSSAKAITNTNKNYTVSSFEKLTTAIIAAEEVYKDEVAIQSDVSTQTTNLSDAIAGLVEYKFGSTNTQISPGVYLVPVKLMQATSPSEASMAGLALENLGILTISEEGEALLQTKWKTIQVSGLSANLTRLGIFDTKNFDDTGAGVKYATIDTTRTYNSKEVPDKINFTIPSQMKNNTGVYVWAETDINHENAALLVIDYANTKTIDVSLNQTAATIKKGETTKLVATFTENGMDATAEFKSSNTNVAVVDKKGTVTAVSAGTATITATAYGITKSCVITVQEAIVKADKTSLSTTLSKARETTNPSGIYSASSYAKLIAAITAAQATYDNGIATQVDVNAQVAALTEAINTLDKATISLNQNTATVYTRLITTVTLIPVIHGDSQAVIWTTSDTNVATVSGGIVTAVSEGTVTITATVNGVSASAIITVSVPGFILPKTSETVAVKGSFTIGATATPNAAITYKSSNKKVATVSAKGVVKGIKKGTATITVTSNGVSKKLKVTVKNQTLKLSKTSGSVLVKGTITIKATPSPTGTVSFKSSNKKIATVSASGVVTGVKKGTATITATINGVSKTYKITVKKQELTLKSSSASVKVGKTTKINATASPTGTITYASSNAQVATVTAKGVVKGIKKGKATITVKINGVSKKYKVTVK